MRSGISTTRVSLSLSFSLRPLTSSASLSSLLLLSSPLLQSVSCFTTTTTRTTTTTTKTTMTKTKTTRWWWGGATTTGGTIEKIPALALASCFQAARSFVSSSASVSLSSSSSSSSSSLSTWRIRPQSSERGDQDVRLLLGDHYTWNSGGGRDGRGVGGRGGRGGRGGSRVGGSGRGGLERGRSPTSSHSFDARNQNAKEDDEIDAKVRLSKRMSELDLCSRREADRLIEAGRVAIRGTRLESGRMALGTRVGARETDIVIVPSLSSSSSSSSSLVISATSAFDWDRMRADVVALHKPRGYVSGQPEHTETQVPAVKLLTRSNLFLGGNDASSIRENEDENKNKKKKKEEGKEKEEEWRKTLRLGMLHFSRHFNTDMTQGQNKKKVTEWKWKHGWNKIMPSNDMGQNETENDDDDNDNNRRRRRRRRDDDDDRDKSPRSDATLTGYVPAGRLDQDSSGLLLFTRSGVYAKKLVSSNSFIDKEYVAHVVPAQSITRQERFDALVTSLPKPNRNLRPLLEGGRILKRINGRGRGGGVGGNDDTSGNSESSKKDDRPLKAAIEAEWIVSPDLRDFNAEPGVLRLVLREGRKHQVRRMCRELLGLHCVRLVRTRIGGVHLDTLPEGMWRPLSELEARSIFFGGKR